MINLFFSYSHKDLDLRNELEKHLAILIRQQIIDSWHDRRIEAGQVIDHAISTHLQQADIILLLVSSDFLASDYCYDIEMKEAMKRHETKETVVIPVILRPCDWHDTLFGKLLATPTDGKPVTQFANLDEAFLDITRAIKRVAKSLTNKATPSPISTPAPVSPGRMNPPVRSNNLTVFKKSTDHEKDTFIDDAFDFIARYFEGSLSELKRQQPQLESRFKKIDAQKFTATIYMDGKVRAECMIFMGGLGGNSKNISYSHQISTHTNSLNESLSIVDDGSALWLKPLGMPMTLQSNRNLTVEGAAEYYWSLLIRPLQRNY
jgi:hypothetical protein